MKKGLTELVFIIDRSGSMADWRMTPSAVLIPCSESSRKSPGNIEQADVLTGGLERQ